MRRVAVLGSGYFAQFQIRAWRELENVELVAVADRDADARARASREASGVAVLSSLDELLALEPDILDIATPPQTHKDMVSAAMGKVPAIICQKPFCTNLAEAEEMALAAGDIPLIIHENFRFQPWYRAVSDLLGAGALGDPVQARFALRPGDGVGPDAYLDRQPYFREMERFLIRETAIHFIDTFRFLFGEVVAVYADLRRCNPAIAGEDAGLVIFEFETGARATFDGNRTLDHGADNRRFTMGELEVEGTKAALRLDGYGDLTIRDQGTSAWAWHGYELTNRGFGGNCVFEFQKHVLEGLNGTRPIETLARDYLANLRIEEAIYRSASEGRRVEVSIR